MIKKVISLSLVTLLISGCSWLNRDVRVEYQEVSKPILVCPPPTLTPPSVLPLESLEQTDRLDYGKVVRAYKASIVILQGDNELLRTELDKYRKTSEQYEKLKQEVEQKFVK